MDRSLITKILADYLELPEYSGMQVLNVKSLSSFGNRPLHIAAILGDTRAIKELVRFGADLNTKGEHGYSALHEAVEQRNFAATKLLLAMGADSALRTDDDCTAADIANNLKYDEIAKLF